MTATLLTGGCVLPMTAPGRVIDPGAVLLVDDRVAAVGSPDQVAAHLASGGTAAGGTASGSETAAGGTAAGSGTAAGAEVVDTTGAAVIPGLHNTHLHSGLLRGTAESLALWEWLATYVDPAHRALTPEIAEAASRLCYAESVLAGTTSVVDMWRYMDGSARAAEAIGLRATLVPYVADAEGYDYFETTATNRELLESVGCSPTARVRAWAGLEHLLYCTEGAFAAAAAMARTHGAGIHTHSSETAWEVEESVRRFGRRPIAELHHRGILGPGTLVAHCVWLDEAEIELLAETGTSVAHCPCSNMKLASGPAPVAALRTAGIAVGLGSDGEKENNTLDLLEEMKFASLLAKVTSLDPTAGDPWQVLAMATVDGARATGLDGVAGALAPGLRADVVVVDLGGLHTTPLLHGADSNVAAHLVFSARGSDVRDVWVDGRRLVAAHRPTTFDVATVRAEAQAAAEELFERRAALA